MLFYPALLPGSIGGFGGGATGERPPTLTPACQKVVPFGSELLNCKLQNVYLQTAVKSDFFGGFLAHT